MKKAGPFLIASAILTCFLYFAIPALRLKFAPDDMMNLGNYWMHGFFGSWAIELTQWNGYRPVAAGFYLPIYHFAGLNPVPYRAVMLAIVGINLFFTFKIAERLTGSQAVATLAAIVVCAHSSTIANYYNTSMIYDVLAFFFAAAAIYAYMTFRRDGHELGFGKGTLIVLLFFAAMKSKETAIVTAGWLLAYELLFHKPWRLTVPIIVCVVGIVCAGASVLSPHGLAKQSGYILEITPHRYAIDNGLYANELFYTQYVKNGLRLFLCWLLLTAICAILRKKELWWCWFALSTGTLPVAFTVDPRGGSSLYLSLMVAAILGSTLVVGFIRRSEIQWAAVIVAAALWMNVSVWRWSFSTKGYIEDHRLTWTVIRQFRKLPQPAPNSRVLVLSNPFPDWDVEFIAMLAWNDHTLDIALANKLGEAPKLTDYNWILTFEGEDLRVVKQ